MSQKDCINRFKIHIYTSASDGNKAQYRISQVRPKEDRTNQCKAWGLEKIDQLDAVYQRRKYSCCIRQPYTSQRKLEPGNTTKYSFKNTLDTATRRIQLGLWNHCHPALYPIRQDSIHWRSRPRIQGLSYYDQVRNLLNGLCFLLHGKSGHS